MSAIEQAFSGPFKHQVHPGAAWEKDYSQNRDHFECEAPSLTRHLIDSSKYQLMDSAVQPITPQPLYNSNLETLIHISVDSLPTKLHTWVFFSGKKKGGFKMFIYLLKKNYLQARSFVVCCNVGWSHKKNIRTSKNERNMRGRNMETFTLGYIITDKNIKIFKRNGFRLCRFGNGSAENSHESLPQA